MVEKENKLKRYTPKDALHDVQVQLVGNLKKSLTDGMKKRPGLEVFVSGKMDAALNPSEALLIGETALIVARFCDENDVCKNSDGDYQDLDKLPIALKVIEDDAGFMPKDLNQIYNSLQTDMREHPELAEFIAEKMRESVSLQEANLIGWTAKTVYDIYRIPFLDSGDK